MSLFGTIQDVKSDAFQNVSVQYPLPTDSDSVYVKDIDTTNSDKPEMMDSFRSCSVMQS